MKKQMQVLVLIAALMSMGVTGCAAFRDSGGGPSIIGTTVPMDELEPSYNETLEVELVDGTVYVFDPPVQTLTGRTHFSAMGASNAIYDIPRENIVAVRRTDLFSGGGEGGEEDTGGDILLISLGVIASIGLLVVLGAALSGELD